MKKGDLFQTFVTDANDMEIPIGPAVSDARVIEPLVSAINIAVASGKERGWHDARIMRVTKINE